jgi:uncharacterized protein YukE
MPNWQPNWRNVVWDHQASGAAAAALNRAADELDRTVGERNTAAAQAAAFWLGNHRLTFDADLRDLHSVAAALAASYRAAAARIQQAAARAAEEQAYRVRERERWHREREDEERRERAERERRERERQTGP